MGNEAKFEIDEDEYVESFKTQLMDVVHAWCQGKTFAEISEMTDTFEGSIIRCMRRLEELLREMCHAAKTIGNVQLENKFAEGIQLIKRDIIFACYGKGSVLPYHRYQFHYRYGPDVQAIATT